MTDAAKPAKGKRRRKHWYFQSFDECVLCGHSSTYRERRYGRKPAREKRYESTQSACESHFL